MKISGNDYMRKGDMEDKIEFKKYLISMLGKKKANELLRMTASEKKYKFIIIDGRQGPTGKTTLSTVLKEHGYLTLELYENKLVELNEVIQHQVPEFSKYVE